MVHWEKEEKGVLYACFIPFRYPTSELFEKGVRVGLMEAQRSLPNAKVVDQRIRERADQLMKGRNYYEVLFVNREGYITEGSRSNFFAIKENRVFTPPVDLVLPGITRGKVLELARELDIEIKERLIHRDELPELEAAFITGTSPCILPLSHIEDIKLNPDIPLVRQLQSAYQKLMCEYLRSHNTVCTEEII